jgi:hypothetical protein
VLDLKEIIARGVLLYRLLDAFGKPKKTALAYLVTLPFSHFDLEPLSLVENGPLAWTL